jgi:hypothetical protein
VRIFDAAVWTSYGQFYLDSSDGAAPDMQEAFAGQSNGLCGAGCPGLLFLMIGPHTAEVRFRVEVHDAPPRFDEGWEDIVEVSFTPITTELLLASCMGEGYDLPDLRQLGVHRVRYSAAGMDEAREAEANLAEPGPDEEPLDRYLLQLWPAPFAPDQVIRQSSESAVYWHDYARALAPPPTAQEKAGKAAAAWRAETAQRWEREQAWMREEERRWGGRLPGERLLQVGGHAMPLAQLDRDLLDQIAIAGPRVQREIARWAARRAYARADMDQVDWIAPALVSLDLGRPLPEPFDDPEQVWTRFVHDDRIALTAATTLDGEPMAISRQAVAIPTLFNAVMNDPLQAATAALGTATDTYGADHRTLLDEARHTFFRGNGRR